MSLANVLAVAGAARNLVLLGDPQQLAQPWRMHPDLCRYTSAAFYGKLHGVDGLGRQEIQGWASGLRLVEVPHQGDTNASPEEAREVARLAEQLTGRTWHDKNGTERSMNPRTSSSSRPTTRRSEPSRKRSPPAARPGSGSGRWTSSRARRHRWSSTPWLPRRRTRRIAAWTYSTIRTG